MFGRLTWAAVPFDQPVVMIASGTVGFVSRPAPVASSRLTNAIAATLAIGAFSLCLVVTLTVLSIRVSMAMPYPG